MSEEKEEGFGPKGTEVYAKEEEGKEESKGVATRGLAKGVGERLE